MSFFQTEGVGYRPLGHYIDVMEALDEGRQLSFMGNYDECLTGDGAPTMVGGQVTGISRFRILSEIFRLQYCM